MNTDRNIVMAFTADQISRLAGISVDRLRYWEKTDAFIPQRFKRLVSGPYTRIYTFQDLVSLRVIANLRVNHGIELQQLRTVSNYIIDYANHPWSSLAVRIFGRHLEFRDPQTLEWISANPFGQSALAIEFEEVSAEAEADARMAILRRPDQLGKITRHRNVMSNEYVFEGTRIPVATVRRLLDANYSNSDVLRCYPTLSEEDIEFAKRFYSEEPGVA